MGRHITQKLLQHSFIKQLNAIQALEQLAPLHAAREHLPQDIVKILELLGKADNIPFNQLYNLMQDCADCYYTKVIKTLTHLLKHNFTDRQTVLVNTARALEFLESYGDRQAKLWHVLTKCNKLPDHFHDLQTTLQTEFTFLKKATSNNIDQFQEAINLQQTCTTSLCSNINTIYAKLAQLERQIQTHCLYPYSKTDSVEVNATKCNSDIDGQIDTLPDLQSHAKSNQEEPTPTTDNSEDLELSQDTKRTDPEPKSVQNPAQYSPHQDAAPFLEQHQDRQRSQLEDKDWEDGQFADADLIDHHNTKTKSNQIRWEYLAQFEKSPDKKYYSWQNTTPSFDYYIPEPEYYNSDTRPKQYKTYQNLNVYFPPPPDPDDLRRWYGRG